FVRWLSERLDKPAEALRVAVGRDSRVSGPALMKAMMGGMAREPVEVLDCGLCTTPAMFMTTVLAGCDGAVMVTASHLPWQRNGYKFFTRDGGLDGADIEAILEMASATEPMAWPQNAAPYAFLDVYTGFLMDMARASLSGEKPLRGLHVVVDAGNGAGGFYAAMLEELGADITGSQFLEPNGRFPNHIPNPEDEAAMQSLSEAVLGVGADMGVLFDADCDRAALVDQAGREINRNRLIALMADVLLAERPGSTIVTDSVTSAGLNQFIARRGGTLHRFKRGYRNVIGEALRLNAEGVDCPLAIETSGHAALRENRFLDDGMYLVTRLIIEASRRRRAGEDLFAVLGDLVEPCRSEEIRLPIWHRDFHAIAEAGIYAVVKTMETIPGWCVDENNREGVRVLCGGEENWMLLRMSVHDPLLVLNAETGSEQSGQGIRDMLLVVYQVLKACPGIDLSALKARL
ncbi:MAG: phosphomannomutase/phosphoglucomutase, partial [Firmicutes bacterium]|nr:phosphomannomutase/phosphoglucomutase [Bacillota bacterium]